MLACLNKFVFFIFFIFIFNLISQDLNQEGFYCYVFDIKYKMRVEGLVPVDFYDVIVVDKNKKDNILYIKENFSPINAEKSRAVIIDSKLSYSKDYMFYTQNLSLCIDENKIKNYIFNNKINLTIVIKSYSFQEYLKDVNDYRNSKKIKLSFDITKLERRFYAFKDFDINSIKNESDTCSK